MTKKINLSKISLLSSKKDETSPETITQEMTGTPSTDTQTTDGNTGPMENSTGPTDQTPQETPSIPLSKRMDELMILSLEPGYRTSGDHPKIKNHPKWMINPKFNGRERWMDLTKITGWNLKTGQIILSRSEIQHRGMEKFISEPYSETKHSDFTIRTKL